LDGSAVSCGNINKPDLTTPTPNVEDDDPPLVVNAPFENPQVENGRRLDLTAGGASSGIHQDKKGAEMGCSVGINGVISSFTAVSQYLSGAIADCPQKIDTAVKERASCTSANSVFASGLTKSAAALSDIAIQCGMGPAIKEKKASRKGWIMASCVIGVDQAATYLAKVGLTLNSTMNHCEKTSKDYNPALCEGNIASEFANAGQVATYLGGAISECGRSILVPSACVNRVAATFTGFADVAEGAGKIAGHCSPEQLSGTSKNEISAKKRSVAVQLWEGKHSVMQSMDPVVVARAAAASMLLGMAALWRYTVRSRAMNAYQTPPSSILQEP